MYMRMYVYLLLQALSFLCVLCCCRYINNKDIVDGMMIVNESKTGKMLESDLPNHFEDKILTVRYVDVDKVPGIEQDATGDPRQRISWEQT